MVIFKRIKLQFLVVSNEQIHCNKALLHNYILTFLVFYKYIGGKCLFFDKCPNVSNKKYLLTINKRFNRAFKKAFCIFVVNRLSIS